MNTTIANTPIAIQPGSGNVYADLGLADAQEMLVKAKLASKIAEIIQHQKLTQQQAAELLAMPQPKVSLMLRDQSRGISESKMLDCLARFGERLAGFKKGEVRAVATQTLREARNRLARLGRDIDIVVKPARRKAKPDAPGGTGRVNVVFA